MRKQIAALAISSLLLAGGIFPFAKAADDERVTGYLVIPAIIQHMLPKKEVEMTWHDMKLAARPVFPEREQPVIDILPETVLTDEEIDMLSRITMAEAESESELGKRLVIDTVLNRVDHPSFPNTVEGVIFQRGQFTPISNGRYNRCYVREEIRQLVIEECQERTNHEVIYFQMGRNCSWGDFLFKEDGHYFFAYKY